MKSLSRLDRVRIALAKFIAPSARSLLIPPNPPERRQAPIERYDFTLGQEIVLGTPCEILLHAKPAITFRADRCSFNVPQVGFAIVNTLKVANINMLFGHKVDASIYTPASSGRSLEFPTASRFNTIGLRATYTGKVPLGFNNGETFYFCCSLQGLGHIDPQDLAADSENLP